jgi:hypothetical protein
MQVEMSTLWTTVDRDAAGDEPSTKKGLPSLRQLAEAGRSVAEKVLPPLHRLKSS